MRLETNQHLFFPPRYQGSDNIWRDDFLDVVSSENGGLTWDLSAILSMLSFGYACGDRTLIKEIRRQPWISTILEDNTVRLESIPPHDYYWDSPSSISTRLKRLLESEALAVCDGREEIYVLLSGGMDSRIVAGIVIDLFNQGKIQTKPMALTWGLANSRDVTYAKLVARTLGMEIIHINLSPQNILENIHASVELLGNLVSPYHLHGMLWCKNLGENALILNGSYGDSIGRAEYSKKHIMELNYLSPKDRYHLLDKSLLGEALSTLNSDLEALKARTPGEPKHVICEHMMQSEYMRGLIGHAMTIINNYGTVYAMFTAPEVYSYMWSIHPAARNNKIYTHLMNDINPTLAEIPWARTNRSLSKRTIGAQSDLLKEFHRYDEWIAKLLETNIFELLEPRWFKETGIFDPNSIEQLRSDAMERPVGFRYDIPLWLCSFRLLSEKLENSKKSTSVPVPSTIIRPPAKHLSTFQNRIYKIRLRLRKNKFLSTLFPAIRKFTTKLKAIIVFPPKKHP